MSVSGVARVQPQPMIAVGDVPSSSRWYQAVLGADSGHGGDEYEQLLVDRAIVLQLHRIDEEHHHGSVGDPAKPLGNGFALWFEMADFDDAARRAKAADVEVRTDVHVNPNAGHREIWLGDPDGYLVVLAEPYGR